MRTSKILIEHDEAGPYEVEVFGCASPKSVIVCSHGNGVRRWDGEKFFYNVAEHYGDHKFLLVDQNQLYEDGCKLNDLAVMVARVQGLIDKATADDPGVPIIVLGHSMGCGVIARLDLGNVKSVVFVAPAAGDATARLVKRYGDDITNGMIVKTSDGLTKYISKEYVQSVTGIVWEEEYDKLLLRYKTVHVFESGNEEVIGEDRFKHRTMPFASYSTIAGAKHNLAGPPLELLFKELDSLL